MNSGGICQNLTGTNTASQNRSLFYDGKGGKASLSPFFPLHICSLICPRRYLCTTRRLPFHAPGPHGIAPPSDTDVVALTLGCWDPGSHSPLPGPYSPSKIPLNLPLWHWAQPCCFLSPSRPCFWKHCLWLCKGSPSHGPG